MKRIFQKASIGIALLSMLFTLVCPNAFAAPVAKCSSLFAGSVPVREVIDFGYKGKPVRQCGGTCYLESAISTLNFALFRENQEVGLSRPFFYAGIIRARIQKHLNHLGNKRYWENIEDSFTADGGTFEHVHRLVQSNETIPTRPINRSLLEIKKEDAELMAMKKALNEILRKGLSRIKPLLQEELTLATGLLKEIMPELKRINPSSYYKLTALLNPQTFNYASLMDIRSLITSVKWEVVGKDKNTSEKLDVVIFVLGELLSERIEIPAIEFAIAQEAIKYLDLIIAQENQSGAAKLPEFEVNKLGNQVENFKRLGITGEVIIDFLKSSEATFLSYFDLDFLGSSRLRRENSGDSLDLPPPGDYAFPNNPAHFAFARDSFPMFQGGMHSVLVTGIRTDADGNLTHMEVMQSWGPYVGKTGRHLISYEYIRQFGLELTGLKKIN